MRKFLILAGVAALAAPAVAQQPAPEPRAQQEEYRPAPAPDPRDEEIRRAMPEPQEVEVMADAATRVVDAILATPVGPLREAIEGRRLSQREREETLGDHAAKDDPYFRERMRSQIALAGVAAGALAERMAVMTPILRETLEDVQRRVEAAARGIPPHDYGRGDPRQGDPYRRD